MTQIPSLECVFAVAARGFCFIRGGATDETSASKIIANKWILPRRYTIVLANKLYADVIRSSVKLGELPEDRWFAIKGLVSCAPTLLSFKIGGNHFFFLGKRALWKQLVPSRNSQSMQV